MSSALLDSDSGLPPPSVPAPAAPPGIIPSASSGAEHSPSQSPSPPPPPISPPSSAFHSVPSKNGASAAGAASVIPSKSSPKHPMQRKHLRKQRDASPGASSTASDSARESPKRGMTTEEEMENGGKRGAGMDGDDAFSWPTQSTYDERRNLLCTEEESSDRCSSDEDDDKASAWNITREQLNYYTTQFFSMQPNPRGVIRGETAKEFFEKSRLPITELRKIWQLSDVTKDGSLSMEEFLTAMHLVVLRRNDIELPDELPVCLKPLNLRNKLVDRHNKDLYNSEGKEEAKGGEGQSLLSEDTDAASARQSSPLSPNSATKSPSSVISSPGNRSKPVNFDFRDARRNPNIIQPVPIRHSPESPVIPTSDDDGANAAALPTVKQGRREVVYEQLWNQEVSAAEESLSSVTQRTLRKSENSTDEEQIDDSTEVDGGQLNDDNEDASPAGAKNLPYDGPVSLPQFSDALNLHRRRASGATAAGAAAKDPSPPLPPRSGQCTGVGVGHARSSSLDLNRGVGPPALPPRQLSSGVMIARRDCKSIQMNIGQFKEKNSVIARTINELHQEVSDALEERIALEFQLEQLKSFGE